MVHTGLLAEDRTIFQPASAGWEFIQSSRIYSNIAPDPAAITLVDADSGMPIATVAGFGNRSDGVRLAGRSYEVMPDSGNTRRVREGGQHESGPRYHTRSLPYATDIGVSTGAALGLAETRLAVVDTGAALIAMTWQGRLVNSCLAEALKTSGVEAKAKSFALLLPHVDTARVIPLLRDAAVSLDQNNPLGAFAVERVVDVGPHFHLLSPDAQQQARRDWLDSQYIARWGERLAEVVVIPCDSPLGSDLIALADL
jgi:hypothetical protein